MDTDELLGRMQDKITIGVMNGLTAAMKEHREQEHAPLWTEVKESQKDVGKIKGQISYWKGALAVFALLFSAALAAVELAK